MEPRNYESGAAVAPPSAPEVPSVGYPTAGNPTTGTPATKMGDFWFYKIAESLRNIITDAGLTPDDGDLTLLLQSVKLLGLPIKSSLLAANGYLVFNGGEGNSDPIIQWGTFTANATQTTVNFPTSFPNAAFCVLTGDGGSGLNLCSATLITNSGFDYYTDASLTGANWLAIGF